MDANILVVLNDNDMSISENVGALNNYLARLLSGRFYSAAWKAGERVFKKLPPVIELAKRAEEHVKGMVMPGTLFEEFGFNYIGPIDGHDIDVLNATLTNLRKLDGPQFLHVVTRKGKGYDAAEDDAILYHGVSKFDPIQGIENKSAVKKNYTDIFSEWLCAIASNDDRLIGITPAMREGSGLVEFSNRFPDRYFDVGIAEQHAVTFGGGLAVDGLKPVVAIYSTFLQRAYDQLIHDVCIQNLDVTFALDRSGLVGADGPTHHGAFDLAYLRCVPNMVVMTPSDGSQCREMLTMAYDHPGPAAVRYPRGQAIERLINLPYRSVEMGRGVIVHEGGGTLAILAFGPILESALSVGKKMDATVVDMRFVKPIDAALVSEIEKVHTHIVTVEDGVALGGAGSAVREIVSRPCIVLNLGLPDQFVEHGDTPSLHEQCGLSEQGIFESIQKFIG